MADEDASVGNLFKEIDEEVRQDKLTALWKKYGSLVIISIIGIVVAVGALEGWKAYDISQREALSTQYAQALEKASEQNYDAAVKELETLAATTDGGYATLARMQEAAFWVQQGKALEAAELYFQISGDTKYDAIFRDLAIILGGLNGLDVMDAQEISKRMQPLIGGTNPWRHSASEIQAFAEAKAGNVDKASGIMKNLSEDATAPAGVRQRAKNFLLVYSK